MLSVLMKAALRRTALAFCIACAAPTMTHSQTSVQLRVDCDLDCVYSVGKVSGRLVAKKPISLSLIPGAQILEAATTDGLDYWSTSIAIRGDQQVIELHAPLQAERAKRMAAEKRVDDLRLQTEKKRDQLRRQTEDNRRSGENRAVLEEMVRLIQKYSIRYDAELKAVASGKQELAQVQTGVSKSGGTFGPLGLSSLGLGSNSLQPPVSTNFGFNSPLATSQSLSYSGVPSPTAPTSLGSVQSFSNTLSGLRSLPNGNLALGLSVMMGIDGFELSAQIKRHQLCANAAIHRINKMTNLIGEFTHPGQHKDSARSALRDAMSYRVTLNRTPSRLYIGDQLLEVQREESAQYVPKDRGVQPSHVSFTCSSLHSLRAAGPPVVRMVNEYLGSNGLVLKIASQTLEVHTSDDDTRGQIAGDIYLVCPTLNMGTGFVVNPALSTLAEQLYIQFNQTGNRGINQTVGQFARAQSPANMLFSPANLIQPSSALSNKMPLSVGNGGTKVSPTSLDLGAAKTFTSANLMAPVSGISTAAANPNSPSVERPSPIGVGPSSERGPASTALVHDIGPDAAQMQKLLDAARQKNLQLKTEYQQLLAQSSTISTSVRDDAEKNPAKPQITDAALLRQHQKSVPSATKKQKAPKDSGIRPNSSKSLPKANDRRGGTQGSSSSQKTGTSSGTRASESVRPATAAPRSTPARTYWPPVSIKH